MMQQGLTCSALRRWTLLSALPGLVRLATRLGSVGLLSTVAHAGVLDVLFPKHEVQVIAVTHTTLRGALLRPVSVANPVYYEAVSAGYRDLGGVVAGGKIPPAPEVVRNLAKILAKQGYLPASPKHEPTLMLIWTWGTLNVDEFPAMSADDLPQQINRPQMLRFLGADKLGLVSKEADPLGQTLPMPGLSFLSADAEMIADLATTDLYVVGIAAYDYRLLQKKDKVLLWTTKISCPSLGLSLPEILPAMLAIAGPYIGRETAKPVSIRASDQFKPDVKIGDPTLVEFIEGTKLPVIDASSSPLAKRTKAKPSPSKE